MQEYKYSYQDWVEGKVETEDLRSLFLRRELSFDDYVKAINILDDAYLKRLRDSLECLKEDFTNVYKKTLVNEVYLNFYIQMYQKLVDKFSADDKGKVIGFESMYPDLDGRENLTINQVAEYLSFDINSNKSRQQLLDKIRSSEQELNKFNYVLSTNFLKWLYWYQEQERLNKAEPAINLLARSSAIEIEKAPNGLRKNHISYIWQNNPNQELPELYQLINGRLIDKDTTLDQFKAIFTGKPLHTIEPIKWHDDNASELLYFIQQLEGTDGSLIEKGERANYQRLKACFVKPDGSPFDSAFKSLKRRLEIDLSEPKQQTIRDIISKFY